MNEHDLQQAAALTSQQLNLSPLTEQASHVGAVKAWLMKQLSEKLHHDLGGLFQALYRIDIPEEQFRRLLVEAPPDDFIEQLAELIIRRQLQKVYFREKYKNH
jgi:hypothetical protein